MNKTQTLETQRLTLQPLVAADAQRLFPLMSDPSVMAHWDISEVDDPDLVAAIVAGQVRDMEAGRAIHWAIRRLNDGQFVGVCDLSDIDRWHHRAEIGFMLDRDAWGQGYGFEAMSAVLTHAAAMNLRKLTARTQLGNFRSDALLEKLGFHEEGLLRGHVLRDGERRDCRLFGLLV